MAKQLGKHPDDLVVSRAMEYREKREEYDMLGGCHTCRVEAWKRILDDEFTWYGHQVRPCG